MNIETKIGPYDGGISFSDDSDSRKPTTRWLFVGAIALIIALLVGAHYLMQSDGPAAPGGAADEKGAPRVTVVVPGKQLVENIVSATGTIAARREMPVGAVGEGGMVTRVLVEPGSWVEAGQVLAVVDRQVQAQQANQLVAQISAAQAEARLAQSELERSQALQSRGFISKADLQRKSANRDAAYARVRVAQAQLAESRARIGRLDIRAPASGLVLTRAVEPGQVVGAGAGVLFRIAQGGQLELRAELSEADLAVMRVGQSAQVMPVGGTTAFTGQIWQISPVINPQSRQGEARIALSYNPALRPGGFASARIISGTVEAPLLAESAVQSDTKGNYVYIVQPDNKIARRDVKVGSIGDKGVSIVAGLTGNEHVVFSAGGFLNPGESVIPERLKQAR